jgi:hypothetical protein
MPFISLGSGKLSADPFLGFLRKVYWPTKLPTIQEGALAACWTIQHAINPTMQFSCLSPCLPRRYLPSMHRPWQRIRPGAGDPINTLGKRQISVTRAKSASGSSFRGGWAVNSQRPPAYR